MTPDVKALRARLGWSAEQLGRFLGVAVSTVFRWESGTPAHGPAAEALQTLEDVTMTPDGLVRVQGAAARGLTMTGLVRASLMDGGGA